jgi:hypothetical protein
LDCMKNLQGHRSQAQKPTRNHSIPLFGCDITVISLVWYHSRGSLITWDLSASAHRLQYFSCTPSVFVLYISALSVGKTLVYLCCKYLNRYFSFIAAVYFASADPLQWFFLATTWKLLWLLVLQYMIFLCCSNFASVFILQVRFKGRIYIFVRPWSSR